MRKVSKRIKTLLNSLNAQTQNRQLRTLLKSLFYSNCCKYALLYLSAIPAGYTYSCKKVPFEGGRGMTKSGDETRSVEL
ncbi:hypothetical protein [Pontibacter sp. HJ8]